MTSFKGDFMTKGILFFSEAQNKLLRGASLLADTVKLTLGPKSQSVLIANKWGKPIDRKSVV